MSKVFFAFLALLLVSVVNSADSSSSDVVTLTTDDFEKFVNEHQYSLVEFYAPWCGHCKRLEPEYEAAAKELKGKVPLAKVDATVETTLATTYEIHGYPTIKAFRHGQPEEYKGGRTKETIVQYVQQMTGPSLEIVDKEDSIGSHVSSAPVVFVGKFKSKESTGFKIFEKVAAANRSFGKFVVHISPDHKDEVQVHRESEGYTNPTEVKDEELFKKFCDTERFPDFGPVNANNFADYFATKRTLVWFAGDEKEYKSAGETIRVAAKKFRQEHNFVWLNTDEFKDHAEGILGATDFPTLVIQATEGRYMFPERKFDSSKKIIKFMEDVIAGKIEKSLMSESIPETNDESVKVVVGKSFNDIVLQKDKDVLLEVYAPWCGHCKKLEPIYKELADSMKDNQHIVIAKMDGTKNESPSSEFKWTGFPTIFFVKAGSEKPLTFDGARTIEGLTEYVKEHSSKPLEVETAREEL